MEGNMANFIDNYNDLKELGVDCEEATDILTDTFNRAAKHLQVLLYKVDNQVLLTLYGYYKQGTEGECNAPKPAWYDMKARSKWEAWCKLGNMSKCKAQCLYIKTIKKLDPAFDNVEDKATKEQWAKVSSMQNEEIVADSDKTLIDFIKEGNIKEVKECLKKSRVLLNKIGEDGLAPIHWAADSGYRELIELFISSGADVNLQDTDGQTALHYASSCGHAECVQFLLDVGAKIDTADNEGNTPLSVASDNTVREILENKMSKMVF